MPSFTNVIAFMKSASEPLRFAALVLAGDRQTNDPVTAFDVSGGKALTPINSAPIHHCAVTGLQGSDRFTKITLIGHLCYWRLLDHAPLIQDLLSRCEVTVLEPAALPSAMALQGLQHTPATTGVRVGALVMPFPDAAVDIKSVSGHRKSFSTESAST